MALIKKYKRKDCTFFYGVSNIHHKINFRSNLDGAVNNNVIPYYWFTQELQYHFDDFKTPYFKNNPKQ